MKGRPKGSRDKSVGEIRMMCHAIKYFKQMTADSQQLYNRDMHKVQLDTGKFLVNTANCLGVPYSTIERLNTKLRAEGEEDLLSHTEKRKKQKGKQSSGTKTKKEPAPAKSTSSVPVDALAALPPHMTEPLLKNNMMPMQEPLKDVSWEESINDALAALHRDMGFEKGGAGSSMSGQGQLPPGARSGGNHQEPVQRYSELLPRLTQQGVIEVGRSFESRLINPTVAFPPKFPDQLRDVPRDQQQQQQQQQGMPPHSQTGQLIRPQPQAHTGQSLGKRPCPNNNMNNKPSNKGGRPRKNQ